mgnify:CR=1 FL=1
MQNDFIFLFTSWGEENSCKAKRASFVAIDIVREVIQSQPQREPNDHHIHHLNLWIGWD